MALKAGTGPLAGRIEPTLAGLGYELVDAQASNHGRFLRIFIDKPEGITVDDCADVSRHLDLNCLRHVEDVGWSDS